MSSRKSLFQVLALVASLGACAFAPTARTSFRIPPDIAVVSVGALREHGSASTLHGLSLHVESTPLAGLPWSAWLTVFDDRDGDQRPDENEILAIRSAFGTRGGRTSFPKVRWSGTANRPALRVELRRDGEVHEGHLLLAGQQYSEDTP